MQQRRNRYEFERISDRFTMPPSSMTKKGDDSNRVRGEIESTRTCIRTKEKGKKRKKTNAGHVMNRGDQETSITL